MRGSSSQARDALRRHFSELQAAAARLLAARLAQLVAQVDALEEQSLRPLTACQTLILQGVGQADQLLREGGGAQTIEPQTLQTSNISNHRTNNQSATCVQGRLLYDAIKRKTGWGASTRRL